MPTAMVTVRTEELDPQRINTKPDPKLTGSEDTDQPNPCEPGDPTQGPNAT
jgi:hypothetical protein